MVDSTDVILVDYKNAPEIAEAEIDVKNERSIINLLPRNLRDMARNIPARYFEMEPDELERIAFAACKKANPSQLWKQLRIALWEAYDYAQANSKPHIRLGSVLEGNCTHVAFQNMIVNDPAKFAWLLTPPPNYLISLRALHETGAKRMQEILEIPVDEKTNPKIMDTQMRIHQNIEMRLHGAIVQRVDERRLNVNVNAQATPKVTEEANKAAAQMSMAEVESRIKELQAETERLTAPIAMKVEMINKRKQTIMDVNGNAPEDGN